jgi:hypothetical protein
MDHRRKSLDSNLMVSKNESDRNVDRTERRKMVLTSQSNEVVVWRMDAVMYGS